jgi:hypothetical protein
MPADPVEFPDAVKIVIDAIDPQMWVPVLSRVPDERPARFVTVRRIGGPRMNLVADEAMLTVEAWGSDEADAHDLCQQARALIYAMRGTTSSGVAVYRITEISGPARLPDLSDHERYTYTVQIGMRGSLLTPIS